MSNASDIHKEHLFVNRIRKKIELLKSTLHKDYSAYCHEDGGLKMGALMTAPATDYITLAVIDNLMWVLRGA